jgi:RNA polymerase sigma factor (sigma-70 family)
LIQTDSEILQGLIADKDEAFSAMMKKYYSSLYRYGRHFTKDDTIITDCIQDVFINIWQNRHKADTISFPRQYLLTSLKRRIVRVTSQNKKKLSLPGEELHDYNFSLEFSIEDIIVEKQIAEENAVKLRQILDQLPARQKEVIYLIYYQQLDHQQVAEVMNINRQSVYNLLHESIRKIREFWQEATVLALALLCF